MIVHVLQNNILKGNFINEIYYPHTFQKGRDMIMFIGRRNQTSVGKAAKNVGELKDMVNGKQL